MKSYLSTPLEVRAALSGELSRLFVPVKPQPASKYSRLYKEHMRPTWSDVEMGGQWKPPYPPESLIYFREAWTEAWAFTVLRGSGRYLYKADGNPYNIAIESIRWNSPATMPREAARIYAKLGEPLVKRVQEVTEEESRGMGSKHLLMTALRLAEKKIEWLWIYPVTVVSINGKPE